MEFCRVPNQSTLFIDNITLVQFDVSPKLKILTTIILITCIHHERKVRKLLCSQNNVRTQLSSRTARKSLSRRPVPRFTGLTNAIII